MIETWPRETGIETTSATEKPFLCAGRVQKRSTRGKVVEPSWGNAKAAAKAIAARPPSIVSSEGPGTEAVIFAAVVKPRASMGAA